MCSSHHNHSAPTAFFNISTLKTNSDNKFFMSPFYIYFYFSVSRFFISFCLLPPCSIDVRLFKSSGVALNTAALLFSLPLPSPLHHHKERFQFLMHGAQREDAPNKRRGVVMMNSFKQMRGCTLLKISSYKKAGFNKLQGGFPIQYSEYLFCGLYQAAFCLALFKDHTDVCACFSYTNSRLFTMQLLLTYSYTV